MAKILYVVPSAHYSGHHPHVAVVEPETLEKNGNQVTLMTACGIINNGDARVKHIKAMNNSRVMSWARQRSGTRWPLMVVEATTTLTEAVKEYRRGKYDVIMLRDGEPFVFLPFLVSLPFAGVKWLVSLTGAVINETGKSKTPSSFVYRSALGVIRSRLWMGLYQAAMARNRFSFFASTQDTADGFDKFAGGVFKERIAVIPWGICKSKDSDLVSKTEARKRLHLPDDALILLSFGAPHPGKDLRVVFDAVSRTPDVVIVHAGTHVYSLGDNPKRLAEEFKLGSRGKVCDYFIPEHEKPLFFGAADAIVLSYTKGFKSECSMLWETCKYHVPVIASDTNKLGDDVRLYKLGELFKAGDTDDLMRAISCFRKLKDDVLWNTLINKGREKFLLDHSDTIWANRINNEIKAIQRDKIEN